MHIVVIGLHRYGAYYASKKISEAASNFGKKLNLTFWRGIEIEDRKIEINRSNVLRPTAIPDDPLVQAYVQQLKYVPALRTPNQMGSGSFFSAEEGRYALEQEFLKAGTAIRKICPNLNKYQRPLGKMVLETLGFGTLFVTYRNCPNNCPLVFWVDYPWYPLFPRKTN